jgi:NADH:ubiquinone oxidoreductase subunit 2 (subunit N)
MPAWFSSSDLYYLLPELVLTGATLLLLVANTFTPRPHQRLMSWLGIAALVASGVALASVAGGSPLSLAGGVQPLP